MKNRKDDNILPVFLWALFGSLSYLLLEFLLYFNDIDFVDNLKSSHSPVSSPQGQLRTGLLGRL